jgi:hypothetical protein
MSERIKELVRESTTDSSGKWLSLEDAERLAELIVLECCNVLQTETISHDGYGYNQGFLHKKIKEHFGVEE